MEKLFELRNLKKYYPILGGVLRRQVNSVKAVDDIRSGHLSWRMFGISGRIRLWQNHDRQGDYSVARSDKRKYFL